MLVGGFNLPFWKIWNSNGMMTFPIYGKIIQMFQTTNQNNLGWFPWKSWFYGGLMWFQWVFSGQWGKKMDKICSKSPTWNVCHFGIVTHAHIYIYIYIYTRYHIYIYTYVRMCVCVCVLCKQSFKWRRRVRSLQFIQNKMLLLAVGYP